MYPYLLLTPLFLVISVSKNLILISQFLHAQKPYSSICIQNSSCSPTYLSGLLGPVSREAAPLLYRQLRQSPARDRLADPARGLERQGRRLAGRAGAAWSEFWPFLGVYADLTGSAVHPR